MKTRWQTRAGIGAIRFFVAVVLMAALIALAVGVWANWDKDRSGDGQPDGFTLHVFDPAWWGMARDDLRPVVRRMRDRALAMREEIWSEGGMLDQAEHWLGETQPGRAQAQEVGLAPTPTLHTGSRTQTTARRVEAEAATRAAADEEAAQRLAPPEAVTNHPIADLPAASDAELEELIARSGEHFAVGLVAFKRARPEGDVWTAEAQTHLTKAQDHFGSARLLLEGTLEEYATRPDHDSELVRFGLGLRERSSLLLLETQPE